uniref:Uncharacterized protein n=1 Tax=viral metagenome TaxID=1070528 RepID=A0A6H2A529_9ZZZZ
MKNEEKIKEILKEFTGSEFACPACEDCQAQDVMLEILALLEATGEANAYDDDGNPIKISMTGGETRKPVDLVKQTIVSTENKPAEWKCVECGELSSAELICYLGAIQEQEPEKEKRQYLDIHTIKEKDKRIAELEKFLLDLRASLYKPHADCCCDCDNCRMIDKIDKALKKEAENGR